MYAIQDDIINEEILNIGAFAMKIRKSQRGISISVVLMVLVIITVIVYAVAAQGIANLNFVDRSKENSLALYAAEAGLADSLVRYKKGCSDWRSGLGSADSPISLANGAYYHVKVTDNQMGFVDITAPDGTTVPPGLCYFLGTGLYRKTGTNSYRSVKAVGVMVKGAFLGRFPYALASGQSIDFNAGTDIYGNVKSSGNITFQAQCDVVSVRGQGSVFAGGYIDVGASLTMEPNQAMKARGDIFNASKVKNTVPVPFDKSYDTLPFVNDLSSTQTSQTGQTGEVLPYPNRATLFSSVPAPVTHNETTVTGDFNLGNGGIHYFPNGVNFTSSANLTGTGTVIVDNGNPMNFEVGLGSTNSYFPVNLVALEGNKTGSGSAINFKNSMFVRGLIYSYGTISSNANFRVQGSVISYKGGQVITGAHAEFSLTPIEVECPGFEAWLGDGSGTSRVTVLSWKRQ